MILKAGKNGGPPRFLWRQRLGEDRWNPGQGWKVKLDTKEKLQWLPRCATRWEQMGSGRQVHARNHLWLPVAEQQSGFRYKHWHFNLLELSVGF